MPNPIAGRSCPSLSRWVGTSVVVMVATLVPSSSPPAARRPVLHSASCAASWRSTTRRAPTPRWGSGCSTGSPTAARTAAAPGWSGPTWLGHVRLSIVDLDAGDQPLPSGDGHWAVVNGEIYNHERLREVSPRDFRTDSDCEAALAAAISDDPDALGDAARDVRLRGRRRGRRPGRRPRPGRGQAALLGAPRRRRRCSPRRCGPSTRTDRPLVEEFPPGHRWTPTDGAAPVPRAPRRRPGADRPGRGGAGCSATPSTSPYAAG